MTLLSRLPILKANVEKKHKSSIYFPCNNILYSAVCFLFILMGIGQTVSHAQTLPGDQIIGFRILNESYNPNNPYQWRLIVEVNYSYNTAHGTMPKVVGYIIGDGPGFGTGYDYQNCAQYTKQTQQGNIINGTQRVNILVVVGTQSESTHTIKFYLISNGVEYAHRFFPFQRVWSHKQAKRIKYTITNATPYDINLVFYPTKNKASLGPGKKTSCDSPIRNGAFPQVRATAPNGKNWKRTINKHGCDYVVILLPDGGIQITP